MSLILPVEGEANWDGKLNAALTVLDGRTDNLPGLYVRFTDTDGNPITSGTVSITVNTDTGQIEDIIFEED